MTIAKLTFTLFSLLSTIFYLLSTIYLHHRHETSKAHEQYKINENNNRRISLENKLCKWRDDKKIIDNINNNINEKKILDIELKKYELEDVKQYELELKNKRRDSLTYKLEKYKLI